MNKEAIDFEQLKQDYLPNVLSGLAGATLAGGVAGLGTGRRADESDEEYSERRKQNAVMAAIAGGAVGGVAPSAAKMLPALWHGTPNPEPGLLSKITPSFENTVLGGAGGIAGLGAGSSLAERVKTKAQADIDALKSEGSEILSKAEEAAKVRKDDLIAKLQKQVNDMKASQAGGKIPASGPLEEAYRIAKNNLDNAKLEKISPTKAVDAEELVRKGLNARSASVPESIRPLMKWLMKKDVAMANIARSGAAKRPLQAAGLLGGAIAMPLIAKALGHSINDIEM
jgi:hypothetical protein